MARSILSRNRRRSGDSQVKLNITSMMDMFTIILVFLLKSFSTQGQLITPASGLVLPTSTIERTTDEALSVKISSSAIVVEDMVVIDGKDFIALKKQQAYLIEPLHQVLSKFANEAKRSADLFKGEFSGEITIQGDASIPYNILTRVMYTCGRAGYPVMNLVVYRNE